MVKSTPSPGRAQDVRAQDVRAQDGVTGCGDAGVMRSRLPEDVGHPDHDRWQRGVDAAVRRGALPALLLADAFGGSLDGVHVLDCGCGVAGSAVALEQRGARATAIDINPGRLASARARDARVALTAADADHLPFPDALFDAVVLQDVIEHVTHPARTLRETARVLRPGGVVYLSTPNRWSPATLAADPHFGIPLAAALDRPRLRTVLRLLRPGEAGRVDLPLLLSRSRLLHLLRAAGLTPSIRNRTVAELLVRAPDAVVWSAAHLTIMRAVRALGLGALIRVLASDRGGIRGAVLAPAWYCIARKEPA